MEVVTLSLADSIASLSQAAAVLLSGQVVLLPTDTIYGLSCLAQDEAAVRRIAAIKGRSADKPLIVLVNGLQMASDYAMISGAAQKYLAELWPGPITAILPSRSNLPIAVTGGLATIAMRWPKNDWLNQLIALVGQPIVSTSANLAGQTPITSIDEAGQYFINDRPDLIIDAGILKNPPSRIIDCQDISAIKIIR